MGLDVTAFSHMRSLGLHAGSADWCYVEGHVNTFAYDCFPDSFRGLPVLHHDKPADSAGVLWGGCYTATDLTKTVDFQAAHPSYDLWRADLARQFNPRTLAVEDVYDPDPAAPFYELIWFADNEGSIGPAAAADLHADFLAHTDAYDPAPLPDDPQGEARWWAAWCREQYGLWTRACELAAADGLIRLH
jgi:hypothetical protein